VSSVVERRRKGEIEVHSPTSGKVGTALTASAARIGSMPIPNRGVKVPQWQLDSLAYYDQIGAVRYAAQFWARGLSKIRFFVGEKDENGEVTESQDEQAISIFERIQDPMGGMVQITSAYGQLRFLAGECYLVWMPENEAEGEPEKWEIVSVLEMRKSSKKRGRETWSRIHAPGLTPEELVEAEDSEFEPMPNEVIVYRLWKRHPAYSMMADAPMRSVLADCEEIVRCTHTINARLISRLSGPGIFAIPQSWKMKSVAQVASSNGEPAPDPFQTKITKAMITAIQTPGSAESVSPIVVIVPDETTDKAHLYKIWDPNEVIREIDLREKAVHRFAVGVDQPAGKVEGIEGTTHWNAWAIDKEGMEHLTPVATDFGNDIAGVYLRPALRDEGREDWAKFVISYDPAEAVTNPDEFGDAVVMYDKRVIGKAALRRAGNKQDTDAMKDAELAEAIFVATNQVVEVQGDKVILANPVEEPPTGEDTETDMPEEPEQEEVEEEAESGEMSAMGFVVLGAAEVAIEEVRKTIGLRVRNHFGGGQCPDCVQRIKDVPASLIVATLGREVIEQHEINLAAFAEDAARGFASVLERQLACGSITTRVMQEIVELHAVNTIYETMPGTPAGFYGRVQELTAR
jgi:hypothetical protein